MHRSAGLAATFDLELPPIDQSRVRGARLVQRAASIIVIMLLVAIATTTAAASLVYVSVTVDCQGVLEPVEAFPLRATQDGLVDYVAIADGDTVRQGEPLIFLDSLDLAANLAALQSQSRALALSDVKLAEVRSAIADARARLERAVLRSPINGIVLGDRLDRLRNAYVHAGQQLLTVSNPAEWHAVVFASQDQVAQIRDGDSVSITVPALRAAKGGVMRGLVVSVSSSIVANNSTLSSPLPTPPMFRVTVGLDTTRHLAVGRECFELGCAATAQIITGRQRLVQTLFNRSTTMGALVSERAH